MKIIVIGLVIFVILVVYIILKRQGNNATFINNIIINPIFNDNKNEKDYVFEIIFRKKNHQINEYVQFSYYVKAKNVLESLASDRPFIYSGGMEDYGYKETTYINKIQFLVENFMINQPNEETLIFKKMKFKPDFYNTIIVKRISMSETKDHFYSKQENFIYEGEYSNVIEVKPCYEKGFYGKTIHESKSFLDCFLNLPAI